MTPRPARDPHHPSGGPPTRIPVTLVCGGTGREALAVRLAALRPGAVLLAQDDGDAPPRPGCPCCGPGMMGLMGGLEALIRARDNGREKPFTAVVALADPGGDAAALLHAIGTHPYLPRRYAYAGSLVAVDDAADPGAADAIALADRAVARDSGQALLLRSLNPALDVLTPGDAALAAPLPPPWALGEGEAETLGPGGLVTVRLTAPGAVPGAALQGFGELLGSTGRLLRLRGVARLAGEPGGLGLHAMRGVAAPPEPIGTTHPGSRLLVTARGLEPGFLRGLWAAVLGSA